MQGLCTSENGLSVKEQEAGAFAGKGGHFWSLCTLFWMLVITETKIKELSIEEGQNSTFKMAGESNGIDSVR